MRERSLLYPRRRAALLVPVASLLPTLASLPIGYSIVGSLNSQTEGMVELVVVSDDIGGDDVRLLVEVRDEGSTRTVRLVPDRPL